MVLRLLSTWCAAWVMVCLPLSAQIIMNGGFTVSVPSAETRVPVSLVMEHKSVQTLVDGLHITNISHEKFYRDSMGRRRIETINAFPPGYQQDPNPHMVMVFDSVSETMTTWIEGDSAPSSNPAMRAKTYTRSPFGARRNAIAADAMNAQPAAFSVKLVDGATGSSAPPQPETKEEDLGMETVQGESCHATRATVVYPEGFFNNDRPMTVVTEVCISFQLDQLLRMRADDPRTGVRTSTLESLSRGEPDPSLFQPPPGYTEAVQSKQ